MKIFPVVVPCVVLSGLLAGCSGKLSFPDVQTTGAAAETSMGRLSGHIHGGQQPIAGAKIYLLAAGTSGYGSAATSLLQPSPAYPGYPVQNDATGNYVLTDGGGNFQIYDTCTPGQQVYIASIGGNPGAGVNTAANEIALLGQCPAAGNFDGTYSNVLISEISTVVAAYTASAYAVDALHIGGPSSKSGQSGMANAFANAANMYDVTNINDLVRPNTLSGLGVVPQAKINTLANIIASCVNSTGQGSTTCATLFSDAKSKGTTGIAPSDTTTAAINIAHNPWSHVLDLYNLVSSTAPFAPTLPASPADFTVALDYPGAALGFNPSLAVDAQGNVWSLVPGQTAVAELSPTGTLLSPASGYAIGGNFAGSRGLAFDTSGNLWVLGEATNSQDEVATFAELSSTGTYSQSLTQAASLTTNPPSAATNLVIDGSGNFYYSSLYEFNIAGLHIPIGNCCTVKYNPTSGALTDLDGGNASPGVNFVAVNGTTEWATGAGNTVSYTSSTSRTVMGGGLNGAVGVALDAAGNAWIANSGNSTVSEFDSAGNPMSSASGFSGGLSSPKSIAVDGLGTVWVTSSGGSFGLSAMTSAGAVLGNGYADLNLISPNALAIDSSGNVWVASASSTTISEFVGAAAPVPTPMAAAIAAGLGTRP